MAACLGRRTRCSAASYRARRRGSGPAARGQDSATKVGNKLKDFFKNEKGHRIPMEEDHLRQGRDEKGFYWEIDLDGCFEWLKNNGYTAETELAPAVVWCSY